MGNYLNILLAVLILVIVTVVSSTYFYKKGQRDTWELAQQLVPLEKGDIYLCVEKTGVKGVPYLTVMEISQATKDKSLDQKELRFHLQLALNKTNLKEYNEKYRKGKSAP